VVATYRDRGEFVDDVSRIVSLLDPHGKGGKAYEGFFLEARDSDGPFVRVSNVWRGRVVGSTWAWDSARSPSETSAVPG
jgi:hypothetical protein